MHVGRLEMQNGRCSPSVCTIRRHQIKSALRYLHTDACTHAEGERLIESAADSRPSGVKNGKSVEVGTVVGSRHPIELSQPPVALEARPPGLRVASPLLHMLLGWLPIFDLEFWIAEKAV
jgi:hypothetical protein